MAEIFEREIRLVYEDVGAARVNTTAQVIETRLRGLGDAARDAADGQGDLTKNTRSATVATKQLQAALDGVDEQQRRVNEEIDDLNAEAEFNRAKLATQGYAQALRQANKAQEKLDRAGRSRLESMRETLEGMDNIAAAVGIATTVVAGFWAAWAHGVASADLEKTAENFKKIAASRASAGTAAVIGGAAATRGALRGATMGFDARTLSSLDGFAEAAARRTVALEGGDFREIMAGFSKQFQDELASGQLGEAFSSLGVSADAVDLAIRNQARAMGLSAEAMSSAAKEAIFLEQGALAAGSAFRVFEGQGQKQQASVKSFLESAAKDVSLAFANVGSDTRGSAEKLAAAQVEFDERLAERLAFVSIESKSATGGTQSELNVLRMIAIQRGASDAPSKSFVTDEGSGLGDVFERADLNNAINRLLVEGDEKLTALDKQITGTIASIAAAESAALITSLEAAVIKQEELREQLGGDGAETLQNLAGILTEINSAQDDADGDRLDALTELLSTFDGFSQATAEQLVNTATSGDLAKTALAFNAKALKVAKDTRIHKASAARQQLAINKSLTRTERIEQSRNAAAQEFEALIAGQSENYDDFQSKLGEESVIRRKTLAEQKAQVDVELEFAATLTKSQREALELRQKVLGVTDEISRSTETTEGFNDALGRVVLAQTFGGGVDAMERLNIKIGAAKIGFGGLLSIAERLTGAINEASGGRLLSSALATREKVEKKKKSGKSGDGGRGDLLLRGELAGLGDVSKELIRIQRQTKKDLKTARGDETLIAAAMGISEAANADLRKRIWDSAKKAGIEATAAAKVERLKAQALDAQNAIRAGGGSFAEQRAALERDAAQRAFEERMELAKGNQAMELSARLDFNDAIFDLDLEAARAREEIKAKEREADKEESKAFWSGIKKTKADMLRDTLQPIAGVNAFGDDFASGLQAEAQAAADAKADAQDAAFAARGSDEKAQRFKASFQYDEETQAAIDAFKGVELALNEMGGASDTVIDNLAKMADGEMSAAEAATGSTTAILGAVGRTTKGVVKDKKAQAFVMGGFELAQALSSTAEAIINPVFWPKAAAHYASSAQFFALGGGGSKATLSKSGGGAGSNTKDRQSKRTSQSTGGSGLPLRRQAQTGTILNIFVDPLSGQAIVRSANGAVSKDNTIKFDSRLNKNSVTRTEL